MAREREKGTGGLAREKAQKKALKTPKKTARGTGEAKRMCKK
jgi:hypothetical protein